MVQLQLFPLIQRIQHTETNVFERIHLSFAVAELTSEKSRTALLRSGKTTVAVLYEELDASFSARLSNEVDRCWCFLCPVGPVRCLLAVHVGRRFILFGSDANDSGFYDLHPVGQTAPPSSIQRAVSWREHEGWQNPNLAGPCHGSRCSNLSRP